MPCSAFFGAGEALFQTGWFIESMTTQVLVVFAIRTRRRFFQSRPHRFLVAFALGVVAIALLLPLSPVGGWFGFVAPPPLFFVFLVGRDRGLSGARRNHQGVLLPRASATQTGRLPCTVTRWPERVCGQ